MSGTAKLEPTDAQVETFGWLIDDYDYDWMRASILDEDGCECIMLIEVVDDGASFHALFDVDGTLIGDWVH